MKLVFVFAVRLIKVLFLNLFEVLEVIGAFLVDAFVNNKMLTVFLGDKNMIAIRTAKRVQLCKSRFFRTELV